MRRLATQRVGFSSGTGRQGGLRRRWVATRTSGDGDLRAGFFAAQRGGKEALASRSRYAIQ